MKYKNLIYCLIVYVCCPVYYAYGDSFVINSGGEYSLSALNSFDSIIVNYNSVDRSMVVLSVDSDFVGNVFNPVFINNGDLTKIELKEGFLNRFSGEVDEILHFNQLTMNEDILVSEANDVGMFVYNWNICSNNDLWCISRTYSSSYQNNVQGTQHEELVATISVKNNPVILLRPMKSLHKHEILGVYKFSDEFFMSVAPEYYNEKDLQNTGIRLNSGTKIGGNLSVGVNAYVTKAKFDNNISNFESDVYGGNLRFNYDLNEILFLRGVGGFSFSRIDIKSVTDINDIAPNPNAIGYYSGVDFGSKFDFNSGLFISPFIGYAGHYEKIADIHESDSFLHIGNDIGFGYFMDGVSYGYILRFGVNSQGLIDADFGISVLTVADKIGGSVSFGVLDTDYGWSGKISANVKFIF